MVVDMLAGFVAGLDVVGAVAVFAVGVLVVLGLRWLIAFLRAPDRLQGTGDVRWATDKTAQWVVTVVGAFASLVALGIVQAADVLEVVTMFVGQHPLLVAHGLTIGLAAGIIEGLVSMSTERYIGIAIATVGAVMFFSEVDDAD